MVLGFGIAVLSRVRGAVKEGVLELWSTLYKGPHANDPASSALFGVLDMKFLCPGVP